MYDQGGLGVVAYEAPESWRKHENADVRDFRHIIVMITLMVELKL